MSECRACAGCGQVANTPDAEPWSFWDELPNGSKVAVRLGLVYPVTCRACGGTGKIAEAEGTTAVSAEQQEPETFAGWADLQIMGHVHHVGYVSEVEMFGAKFLKVEPIDRYTGEAQPTIYYRPESVYSLSPMAEAEIRAAVERARKEALRRQKLLSPTPTQVEEEQGADDRARAEQELAEGIRDSYDGMEEDEDDAEGQEG